MIPSYQPASQEKTRRKSALAKKFFKATGDLVFHHMHGGKLIYNACWEDPRIDRQLLQLDGSSRVVMITSAGCNALDYLLDEPAEIHAVDMNYRQNALLELKLAMLQETSFADFFEMFGIGSHSSAKKLYRSVSKNLSTATQKFWDKKINYFHPGGVRRSFYYHGTAGTAAWMLGGAFFKTEPNAKNLALCLFDAEAGKQQRRVSGLIEDKIWNDLSNWLIRQQMLMTLLGVPRSQVKLIDDQYPGGLEGYVKDKLRHVMSELPVRENYFWRVYLTGSYTLSCCPLYLREENQTKLARHAGRIQTHTSSITQFLKKHPGEYSHYVLLDHQDWLAWHDPAALREEWELILANSRPGTRILLRSAALDINFIPDDILARLRFFPELTESMHQLDRVGTYGSLAFAEVL